MIRGITVSILQQHFKQNHASPCMAQDPTDIFLVLKVITNLERQQTLLVIKFY